LGIVMLTLWTTSSNDQSPTHTCWQDIGVVRIATGTSPLLPSPQPDGTWRFVATVVLKQEDDGNFLVEYQFERSIETTLACSEAWNVAISP